MINCLFILFIYFKILFLYVIFMIFECKINEYNIILKVRKKIILMLL